MDPVLDDLRALVEAESPSSDPAALRACARVLVGLVDRRLPGGAAADDAGCVRWQWPPPAGGGDGSGGGGAPRPVLLLGHLDTVWPLGTLQRLPFRVGADGRVTGPGTFDMKAGLVVAVHALARLHAAGPLPAVRLLVTADEEVGSPRSRALVEEEARRCGRVLVLEPCGPAGAVKTARKGVAVGEVVVHGRASHAGLAPHEGVNAAVVLGRLLPHVAALSQGDTTVTPTLVTAGSAPNTVPARAEARLDIRFFDPAEPNRVRAAMERLDAGEGRVEVGVTVNRPPLPPSASRALLPALRAAAERAGQQIRTVAVGGASDGNLAAAAGAAVLDGLGPEGGGAHADDEHVLLDGLQRRVDLLEALIPAVAAVDA